MTAQRADALKEHCVRVGAVNTAGSTLSIWRRQN
jgi:hypothetical protein